jgi:hypothetical protein
MSVYKTAAFHREDNASYNSTIDSEGRQYVAGTLELRDGKIVTVPRTQNQRPYRTRKGSQ